MYSNFLFRDIKVATKVKGHKRTQWTERCYIFSLYIFRNCSETACWQRDIFDRRSLFRNFTAISRVPIQNVPVKIMWFRCIINKQTLKKKPAEQSSLLFTLSTKKEQELALRAELYNLIKQPNITSAFYPHFYMSRVIFSSYYRL